MKEILLKNYKKAIIRKASPKDAQEIIDYLNKIGGESDFLTFGENEFNISLENEEKYINSHENINNSIIIVTLIDGEIVSIASITSVQKDRLKHVGSLGISVLNKYWRLGISNEVMNYLINWAKFNDITKKITLLVREDNYKAINLYKKFGFEEEGIFKNDICINGIYYNTISMALLV
ncbi:GNAT family protein [Clostridium sp. CCUG 7971]|uniref:GNAT family N-acetyltransferase n=1 Tax=Clostridium sp. CCUG 7971 TaxID=2811414 RepID=UPI001ABB59FD|nr:GNAT family protein [Clostridium sp. CCUG 7971]MBO3443968.1 GNAT family N-acetyltransferase [Clostridium sp. CCUG 7971]